MSDDPRSMTAASLGLVDDPSIPVLTERIVLPSERGDVAPPAAMPAVEAGGTVQPELATPAVRPPESAAGGLVEVHVSSEAGPEPEVAAIAETRSDRERPAESLPGTDPESTPPQGEAEQAIEVAAPFDAIDTSATETDAEALRAAVLQRVSEQLPAQVDAAVRDLMQPAIEEATARIAEEARAALQARLEPLVAQILREELARAGRRPPQ